MENDAQRSESSEKVVYHSSKWCGEDSQRKTTALVTKMTKVIFVFYVYFYQEIK